LPPIGHSSLFNSGNLEANGVPRGPPSPEPGPVSINPTSVVSGSNSAHGATNNTTQGNARNMACAICFQRFSSGPPSKPPPPEGDEQLRPDGPTQDQKTGSDISSGVSFSYMLVQCNHYVCTNCANLYKGK
jgi:hypothetical protein